MAGKRRPAAFLHLRYTRRDMEQADEGKRRFRVRKTGEARTALMDLCRDMEGVCIADRRDEPLLGEARYPYQACQNGFRCLATLPP